MPTLDIPADFSVFEFTVLASFVITFLGMAAGAIFFALERNSVALRYRSLMTVSAVILFIATANYYFMLGHYSTGLADGGAEFVTVYRYVDWILTTPLMLIKFPLILGLGPRGRMFMVRLILLDLIMITFGFFGELNADNAALRYGFFAVGGFAWLIILGLLFKAMNNLPASTPDSVISGARIMFFFILIGWSIYPIGYVLPTFGMSLELKNLVYNIGDLVNKVGLALVVYAAVVAVPGNRETTA